MTPALRFVLTAITIVNLAFVHATEDASLVWLAPMYAVALASPVLAKLEKRGVYRWAWNIAVIAIFGVLVRHTAADGPRHLLEDGLRLAAVSQVHLLCNLGERQKPDLFFFNSFLIAVVTAFLTQDFAYSGVFIVYAPLLVAGLALYAAQRAGREASLAIARDSLGRAGLALTVTLLVFVAWPRDFHRKGLVVETLSKNPAGSALELGFSEEVRLDREGGAGSSDRVVARVRILSGSAADVSGYFRGATQLAYASEHWESGHGARLGDPRWAQRIDRALQRELEGDGPSLRFDLEDTSASRLFVPLDAKTLSFEGGDTPPVAPLPDATLRFSARGATRPSAFRYDIGLAGAGRAPAGQVARPAPQELAPALDLSAATAPAAFLLARQVRDSVAADAPQHVIVEAMRERLASRTDYLAPGAESAARDIDTFASGQAGGHCEHFATALVLMLRHVGVPCRLVTGYYSDEWDPSSATLTIRRRHAHAWAEVKDPTAGWMTVDATPATARASAQSVSLLALARGWLGRMWDRIVFFDGDARGAVAAWFAALPGRAAALVRDNTAVSALVAVTALACLIARRRRIALRIPADVREYRACVARLRLAPRPGETPRELLARAASTGAAAQDVERLAAATRRHEAARFGARA